MKLYNSNTGHIGKQPRRRIGQIPADLKNEFKNMSKLEMIKMCMRANVLNIKLVD